MKTPPSFLVGRIILPLAIIILFNLAPMPSLVVKAFQDASHLSSQNQPAAALKDLNLVLDYYPWRADVWECLGMDALQAGDFETAIRGLKRAQGMGGLSTEGYIQLGDAYDQAGDVAKAISTWKLILQSSGPSIELFQRLEENYKDTGNYDERVNILQQWVNWQPQDGKVIYRLGLLVAARQPDEGLKILLEAAQIDPGLDTSVRILQTGINSAYGLNDLAYQLVQTGRAMGSLGEWDAAAEAFTQAVKTTPSFADGWAFLGQAQQYLGLDGQSALQKALTLNPDSLITKAMQALYWQQQGQVDKALAYLQAVAILEPNNGIWQVEIGNIAAQKGDLATAVESYHKALQIEPRNPVYWRVLAAFSANFDYNLTEIGLPAARQAVTLAPDDPANQDVLGQVLSALHDLSTAERFFLKALSLDPQYSPAYLHIGLIYLDEGENSAGLQALKQAVKFAPSQSFKDQVQKLLDRYSQ